MRKEFTSGLTELDAFIKFHDSTLVAVSSRPGVGKTLFILNQAIENAKAGIKTLFVSSEMPERFIRDRILNNYIGVNLVEKYTDSEGNFDVAGFKKEIKDLENDEGFKNIIQNLQVYNSETNDASKVLQTIESIIERVGCEIVFIDCLQSLSYDGYDPLNSAKFLKKNLKGIALRNKILIVAGIQASLGPNNIYSVNSPIYGNEFDLSIRFEKRVGMANGISTISLFAHNNIGNSVSKELIVDYSCGKLFFNNKESN